MFGVLFLSVQANKVVIFDPAWSERIPYSMQGEENANHGVPDPAHDLQAMDRAFRIGQKRPVYISNPLPTGTIWS